MPDAKTFIILTPGFPAHEADTTCLPPKQQFVQQLHESYPEVNIIVLAFQYPFKKDTYQWKNVTVISFNGRNRSKWHRLRLWSKVWRKLKLLNRQHDIMGLFSFWYSECALIGKFFSRRYNVPHFTWIPGQDAKKGNKYVRWARPQAHELVALSDFVADTFERNHGVRPQHIIPYGIDPRLYAPFTSERDIAIMGTGALIPLKQYDLFIDLVGLVKTKHPGITAVVCGKGPEDDELHEQVRRLQLEENIILKGETQYPEVLRLMQRSRIFLHTSSYEGLGMVCLEALYAGAHVISFCKPFNRQIPHWHIVRTKEEMLDKLLELLETPLDHEPVIPFWMKDTAAKVMGLY
jgi:glycosyltransferase involved in cell wall biosynthesis